METMQTSFGQMGAPFPEEPVGVGATWRVTSNVELGGMRLDQVTTFALVERSADGGKLDIDLKQSAKPGVIDMPRAGQEAVDLIRMLTTGKGVVEFDLQSPATTGTLDMTSDVQMKAGHLGAARVMRTRSKMHIEIVRAR